MNELEWALCEPSCEVFLVEMQCQYHSDTGTPPLLRLRGLIDVAREPTSRNYPARTPSVTDTPGVVAKEREFLETFFLSLFCPLASSIPHSRVGVNREIVKNRRLFLVCAITKPILEWGLPFHPTR